MQTYDSAEIKHMTLEEAKDFLWDRYAVFTKKIESELDVTWILRKFLQYFGVH